MLYNPGIMKKEKREILDKVLTHQGRNYSWLARKLGMSPSGVWRMLRLEEREPSQERLEKIADVLELPYEVIWGKDGE